MSKTILITGASSGFGRDMVETLGRAGHTVFASMCDPQAKNRNHSEALKAKSTFLASAAKVASIASRAGLPNAVGAMDERLLLCQREADAHLFSLRVQHREG